MNRFQTYCLLNLLILANRKPFHFRGPVLVYLCLPIDTLRPYGMFHPGVIDIMHLTTPKFVPLVSLRLSLASSTQMELCPPKFITTARIPQNDRPLYKKEHIWVSNKSSNVANHRGQYNQINVSLSLTRMSESSSESTCQPTPAVSTDPSTQQSIKVLANQAPQESDPEEILKNVLAKRGAIARQLAGLARRLGLKNSPSRWQGGQDGWFFATRYIEWKDSETQRLRMTEIRKWPTKISTLPPERQIIAYQSLLKTARLDQVAAYYRLHCEQLDNVRCCVVHQLILHRQNDEHFRQVFPVLFSRQADIAESFKLKRAAYAAQVAAIEYGQRARYRAYARGLELLIETCEVRLQRTEHFAPADWRSYNERPRYVHFGVTPSVWEQVWGHTPCFGSRTVLYSSKMSCSLGERQFSTVK